ncbi:alpha-amylase family glycosyl hydrolase [Actinomyces faecalis]|uniref:alpha-amylase family glycosyl hydrolase n=1 Tax=Actinomyces faecalis TaxID=2722820 RepID=UPI0015527F0E|nr:alpha-amylase family glycosyl hydrolase [Actinomyces faecalis]
MHADDAAIASPGPAQPAAGHSLREPSWVRHAIAWHVYPLGAVGAPALCPSGDPDDPASPAGRAASEHRLLHLVPWLDHLIELGANVLLLGPVFHAMSHGYDTVDYYRVDPRLGTNEDLTHLIDEAHARGVKVVLDGVFNHTGIAHPGFTSLPQAGPDSPQARGYRLTWPDEPWTPGTPPSDYARFEGQDWLPELNHDCPEVAQMTGDVMEHWCEAGADGWRLDAAYAVPPSFWTRVLPRLRSRFPEVYVFGEVIHGDYSQIVTDSGMDSVTQYELWQAAWHALAEANFYELDWCLGRHAAMLETFVPWTFLGNHDTTRIASAVGGGREGGDRLPHAVALLMMLPGTPAVYYGDEVGLEGVKEERLGGDEAIRPELPRLPRGHGAHESLPSGDQATRTARLYRQLIALRRRLPWLHDAEVTTLHLDNRLLSLRLCPRGQDRGASSVVLALSLEEHEAWLPTGGAHTVLATGEGACGPRSERDGVVLPPCGWAVLG